MQTQDDIRAIVGLGNPGPDYRQTRHNVGFLAVEALTGPRTRWERIGRAFEAEVDLGGRSRRLVCPQTFMNRSGWAVAELLHREGWKPEQVLVVYDDIDLTASRIRIRRSGGAGTHRGVESVLAELGTGEFPRVRVGVGGPPPGMPLDRYVLEPLAGEAWEAFSKIVDRAADAVRVICEEGVGVGMNRFNPMPPLDGANDRAGESESDTDVGGKR